MLFDNFIDGFTHLENYFSPFEQNVLWETCHIVFTAHPLWRPAFAFGRDKESNVLTSPYALENTNCGEYGWLADEQGQRYSKIARNGQKWSALPKTLEDLVVRLKKNKLIPESFRPENCLINKYQDWKIDGKPKLSRLGLHRDKSEYNLEAPIISISLGLSAIFQIGGLDKTDSVQDVILTSGDLVIMGGGLKGARNAYHGVKCVLPNSFPRYLPKNEEYRLNITIRQVN